MNAPQDPYARPPHGSQLNPGPSSRPPPIAASSTQSYVSSDDSFSHPAKMPQYTSRDVGDPSQIKKNKQSMADLKLRRLTELNNRLREDLDRERIPVSQAAKRYGPSRRFRPN